MIQRTVEGRCEVIVGRLEMFDLKGRQWHCSSLLTHVNTIILLISLKDT
jgi:hypothetical protein